jgi:hypothetical protein
MQAWARMDDQHEAAEYLENLRKTADYLKNIPDSELMKSRNPIQPPQSPD